VDNATHVGLDVHRDTIAVAVLAPGETSADERTIPATPEAITRLVRTLRGRGPLLACYEAGPTGYDTQRLLDRLGVPCEVIAPAMIPRRPGSRVKTDRLDARNLARLHRAGELTAIRIPSPAEEALRDLVRVREDLKAERRRARQRIRSFLLQHGRPWTGTAGWSRALQDWAVIQRFDEPAAQATFEVLLAAQSAREAELDLLEGRIVEAAEAPPAADRIARLRCLRGIDTLIAVTIVSEVCDFARFPSAGSFMAFTGLVPSEHSSGMTTRRGAITKAGNRHVRRVLVEAAWAYRHRPAIGVQLRRRSEGQPAEVRAFCWKAQLRLHARYRRLTPIKGSRKAVVAVARELSGFVWALMNDRID
jgi:transposase